MKKIWKYIFSVQFSHSVVSDSLWPHGVHHARPLCPSPTPRVYSNSCPLSRWCPLILCYPLLSFSILPSIRVFSNESVFCIRWPKYWSFSFNMSPSNEHPGLISFRMDWLDLLSVQGTLKHSLALCFLWDWNESQLFPVLWKNSVYCWVFQICWQIECSTFTVSSSRIWNSSTGIPSTPLALFVWCFLRPTWLHIPGCLAPGEWSYHHGYLSH